MIELLICDDSDEARAALRTMLGDHEEIALVGEAADGNEAVERALELRPDVVLMDLHMPIVDGVDATRRIAKLLPSTRVVAYSGADDSGSVSAMLEAGAAAYCVKGEPLSQLERAIGGRSVSDIAALAASAFASERRPAHTHARRDPVTGLASRHALDERLEAALLEAAAVKQQFAVILFDLDDFERFNDTRGRASGDAALAQVARTATRVLRAGEELFRVGGDEFAVVIGGGDEAGRRVAERVMAAVGAQTRGGPLPTISAGVATYPLDGRGRTELLAAAYEALDASKRRRTSRVSSTRPRGGASAGERGPAEPFPTAGPRGPRVPFVGDPNLLTL